LIGRINEHGVSFDLTPERRARLKGQGVEDSELEAIARARRK